MKSVYKNYHTAESLKLFEGMTLKVLLSGSETSGEQAIFEDIVDPGVGPARHIHHKQDETFIFLEGEFDVEINGKITKMSAGDVAFIPKGTSHAWKNISDKTGRLLYIFTPALNIESMFRAIHSANKTGELSEEVLAEFTEKYPEQETVGPPL